MRIDVKGDKELVEKFNALIRKAATLGPAMKAAGNVVAEDAKRKAPVRTGELRDSISVKTDEDKKRVSAHVGTDVFYARFIEKGRRRAAAKPFLRPALKATQGEATGEMVRKLKGEMFP